MISEGSHAYTFRHLPNVINVPLRSQMVTFLSSKVAMMLFLVHTLNSIGSFSKQQCSCSVFCWRSFLFVQDSSISVFHLCSFSFLISTEQVKLLKNVSQKKFVVWSLKIHQQSAGCRDCNLATLEAEFWKGYEFITS